MLAFVLGEDSGFFFFLEVVWDTPKKKKKITCEQTNNLMY